MEKPKQIIFSVLALSTISGVGMFSFVSAQEDSQIPVWIKTAVGFWVNGQLSDAEFLSAIEYFVENEMINLPSQIPEHDQVVIDNLHIFQGELNMKMQQSRELVNLPQIQQALADSNTSFAATGDPEEIIKQVEERWESSAPDVEDSVAYNLIHNPTADILNSIMEVDQKSETQFKYAEIFVTNEYGAIIAQTHKTSDFRQDDEMWWQQAKEHGVFFSEGGFDESAEVYASDIVIRIVDENGNFIGVLKAVVNVESIIQ